MFCFHQLPSLENDLTCFTWGGIGSNDTYSYVGVFCERSQWIPFLQQSREHCIAEEEPTNFLLSYLSKEANLS